MAANRLVAEVYQDHTDRWRWRLRKGRSVLADSGQGYSRKADCLRGMRLVTGFRNIEVEYPPAWYLASALAGDPQ